MWQLKNSLQFQVIFFPHILCFTKLIQLSSALFRSSQPYWSEFWEWRFVGTWPNSADISLGGDRYFSPRKQISFTIAHYLSVWWISLRLPLVPHSAKKLVCSSHSVWWIAIIYRALITPVFKFWNYGLISCLYSMVLIPENLTGVECCLTIHNIKTFWKVECLKRC